MTYAQFLLIFLLIPIAALVVTLRTRIQRRHALACAAVCLLAFAYTSPWDNHAAHIKLWTFDSQFAAASHFLYSLPWEEYAFYFAQGIFICLLTLGLSRWLRPRKGEAEL